MIACTMIPNDFNTSPVQGQQIDEWDFVLRNAFVLASSPIKKALRYAQVSFASDCLRRLTRFRTGMFAQYHSSGSGDTAG